MYLNFINIKKISYWLSSILIMLSFFFLYSKGLNLSVDFTGGTVIEVHDKQEINIEQLKPKISEIINDYTMFHLSSNQELMLKYGIDEKYDVNNIKNIILTQNPSANFVKIDKVGPQIGGELITNSILAIIFALIGIIMYLWYRFEWQFSIGAVLSLIHDAIITFGFFALTQLEFNLTSIAAILTIIGYSVNDSVVIYDRIRENILKFNFKKIDFIINKSINDTMTRTIFTVLTTLLANLALIIYGGKVIASFSIVMFFGIIIGTYSSICISAPIIIDLNTKKS